MSVADRIIARVGRRSPDFYVGGKDRPYLLRWWVIPRNRVFNIYLHKFLRDDEDRALHDHPWWSLSFVLRTGYFEVTHDEQWLARRRSWPAGSVILRRPTDAHRIVLHRDMFGKPKPAWTLFVTGPRLRTWGFWCGTATKPRFVPWQDFVDQTDHGNVGRGCGETQP